MANKPPSPTPSLKGKQRVSFAATPPPLASGSGSSERTPLLGSTDEDGEAGDHVTELPFPSRLHRKLKKGLQMGGARMRRTFPGYRANTGDRDEYGDYMDGEITTQKLLLYSIVALVVVAAVLAGVVIVQSNENKDHSTGPFPRPPSSPTTSSIPPAPTSTPKPQIPVYPFPSGLPRNPAFLAKGRNGGVASEEKRCSDIGIDMLKRGGSAVDAAVASTICIGTMNMFSSGIGGGGFMTVRVPSSSPKTASRVWTIDFRETVPAAGNASMFGTDAMKAFFGGMSVGIPGELKGLAEAHGRWGRLPWKDLILPSAEIADGWTVTKELNRRLVWLGDWMPAVPDWASVFAPNGTLLVTGQTIRRPEFAKTLRSIANLGADSAFYNPSSPIAQAFVEKVRAEGGIMTLEDLEGYKVKVEEAMEGTYRGKKVYVTGAPSSGPALLHILNLMEKWDMGKKDAKLNVHRLVEAMKFGFAARTRISDPLTQEDLDRMKHIPTKAFADEIFPRISDDRTFPPEYYDPMFDTPEDHGTTHISVIDKEGMAVSLTSTINIVFGSRVMDPVTGIIMNDELADFSLPGVASPFGLFPSPYNYPDAGKRPLSSIVAAVLENEDGSPFMALGGSGGSRIFGSIVQVILNYMDRGMDLSTAIEEPRVHDQLYPLVTDVESTFWEGGVDELEAVGHNVTSFDINRGVAEVQAVAVDLLGEVFAASDSRKNGIAAAY